jgi:hypothetical protein
MDAPKVSTHSLMVTVSGRFVATMDSLETRTYECLVPLEEVTATLTQITKDGFIPVWILDRQAIHNGEQRSCKDIAFLPAIGKVEFLQLNGWDDATIGVTQMLNLTREGYKKAFVLQFNIYTANQDPHYATSAQVTFMWWIKDSQPNEELVSL